jgi:hypothetical protein
MSFLRNHPKCRPTHFLPKIINSLYVLWEKSGNTFYTASVNSVNKLATVNKSQLGENSIQSGHPGSNGTLSKYIINNDGPLTGQKYSSRAFLTELQGSFLLRNKAARWFVFKPKIKIWVNFGGSCYGKSWYIL